MVLDISVVMPNYNCQKYLPFALDSINRQTLPDKNYEVIIVDDASTDDSWKFIQSWAKNRSNVRIYKNKKNSGQSISRNRAIDVAGGEYIALLDSDDLFIPSALENSLNFLSERPNVIYSYSAHKRIDEVGSFICDRRSQEFSFEDLFHYNFVGPLTCFSRKEHLEVGGFDSSLLYGQDWDHVLRFAQENLEKRFVFNPSSLYLYRWHSDNISNTKVEERKNFICSFLKDHLKIRGISGDVSWSHLTDSGYNYFDWDKKSE